MRGQCHAPAAPYLRERPGTHCKEAGWAPWPVWTGAENLASTGIFFIVTSVLYSYIHTSLLSGPDICICTLTLFYYVWTDIVFLLDLLLRVRLSLRLSYLVTSVLAHMVGCVRRACFGVNDCFCMVVITVACLGP